MPPTRDRRGFLGDLALGGAAIAMTQPAFASADEARSYLTRQLETAWLLASYHLETLSTEECLWPPASKGLRVHRDGDGSWRADWPDREGYDIGPASIGWTTWHMAFWWSMVIDHSFGGATLTREQIRWPGSADGVRTTLAALHDRWRREIDRLGEDDLRSKQRTRWPFADRPFGDVIAWATVELTKNAAEVGYGRFLFAVRAER